MKATEKASERSALLQTLKALQAMEDTGGEPDVIARDKAAGMGASCR